MAIDENKIVRFPEGAQDVPFDEVNYVMAAGPDGKFKRISKNALKNGLTIENGRMQSVAPGALPAGPAGQTRYMEVTAVGTWTYGGTPVGSNAEGFKTTFWWTGDSWVDNGSVRVKGEQGANGKTIEVFNPTKTGGYAVGDSIYFPSTGKKKIYLVTSATAMGESPSTHPVKFELQDINIEVSDNVTQGNQDAVSGGAVYNYVEPIVVLNKTNYLAIKENQQNVGIDNIPLLSKGGLTLQGVEVDYVISQPRMRTDFIPLQNQKITITSEKEMIVIVYDVSKKFRYNSGDWSNSVTLDKGFGFFRIMGRNLGSTTINDVDLDNSYTIKRFNEVKDNRLKTESLLGALSYETKSLKWKLGYPDSTTEEIIKNNYSIHSTYFKNDSKQITINVASGYRVGVRVYKAQEANAETLVGYYASAQSQSFTLDDSYYLRLFVIANDTSKVFDVNNISEVGLTYTGITPNYQDFIRLAKERSVQSISKSLENGSYNLSKQFVPSSSRKTFLYDIGTKGAFIYFEVGSAYSFDLFVWKGNVNTDSVLGRKNHGIFVKSGYQITVNIKKSNGQDFDGSENIGVVFQRIDEIKQQVGFINLNAKLHKSHYNADEYGIEMDSTTNSDKLNELVDYVHRHGGGSIVMPIGVYDFYDRVILKSFVDIFGYGQGKSILRMLGTTKRFSLFDNKDITIRGCRYRDFTVDGYDLNPADGVYSTDMKAFNFHAVQDCDFTNLTLQGTPATGLGIDYLHGVTITNNHVIECGRLWLANGSAEMQGGSGIGIGTGVWLDENFIVSHNVVEKCGQNGIFIEDQGIFSGITTPAARGSIIDSNIVRNGKWNGIALRGNTRVKMTNNMVYSNVNGGFFADKYLRECDVSHNTFINNRYGIYAVQGDNRGSYDNSFKSNVIKASTIAGIHVNGTNSRDFDFRDNSLMDNAKGIVLEGSSDNFYFEGQKIRRSSGLDIDVKGSHHDLVFKNTSFRGAKSITATFTGDQSEIDL